MRKTWKWWKRDHFLPLRIGGSDFGLKTGSRGTPWNSKSAGPGGSENTNCRFWPFIWHFGLFQGGSFFDTFFVTFCWFQFYHFSHFFIFSLLSLFEFCCFSQFYCFFTFWWFWRKHDFSLIFIIFWVSEFQGKDKTLFWPLFLTVAHSHGKHLVMLNS